MLFTTCIDRESQFLSKSSMAFISELPFQPTSRISHSNLLNKHTSTLRRPRSSFHSPFPASITINYVKRIIHPSAVLLPPGGAPLIPDDDNENDNDDDTIIPTDDDDDEDDFDTFDDMDTSTDEHDDVNRAARPRLDTIDTLLRETKPDYETWVDRNERRSLTTFRGTSQYTLGADELNESLKPDHLQRHRHVLAPDEKFGAIFSWDVVVRNSRELERLSWAAVAEEESLPPPDIDDIVRAEEMAPEAAVSRVFYWTNDWGEIKRHVFRKHEFFEKLQSNYRFETTTGIEGWLLMLTNYGVKCVLCATRPRKKVEQIVKGLGLERFFTKNEIISIEDEYDTLEQMFLVAALKSERPPGKCVVFTDKPRGITAGHEVSSKVVALVGAHRAYEMKTADQIVSDFDDLVVYNIRRLFSEEGMEFMNPQTELEHDRK